MNYRNKHTKIVATISDMRCSVEYLSQMFAAGMDVVRMNTAHQTIEGTLAAIKNVREANDTIPILIDTKGPEIRTMPLEKPVEVKKGEKITFTNAGSSEGIAVNYGKFVEDIPVGSTIMVDDAHLCFVVKEKTKKGLVCVAQNDGTLKGKKSVNVPSVSLSLPSVSKKDAEYIAFAVEHDIEFIAHSFVRTKEDVLAVRALLGKKGATTKIIAKIENAQGVENIEEILTVADGIMVARGDLGVEVAAAQVPMMQKHIIKCCIAHNKPVIVATQMLESMIKNPRPTRAEVSDVANAILDGTSAVMLSAESAYGDYPIESVRTLATIAIELEAKKADFKQSHMDRKSTAVESILAKAAIAACTEVGAKAIVCPTKTGRMARYLSSFRGKWPVYAECYDKKIMRQLALSYGVVPSFMQKYESTDSMVSASIEQLLKKDLLRETDYVVLLARTPGHDEDHTNFLEITQVSHVVKNYGKKN
jgi:pyruvate kinase